mgnify:FL=1
MPSSSSTKLTTSVSRLRCAVARRADLNRTDNVCIESLSIDLTRPMLDAAGRSVDTLTQKIEEYVFSLPQSDASAEDCAQDQEDGCEQVRG